MIYQIAAEGVLAIHFGFVLFVVFGGIGVRWRPRLAWVHVPLFAWGSIVNLASWVCPLTPIENAFRRLAGESGYAGSFLEEYIVSLVYPGGMTRDLELLAGLSLPAWNLLVYAWVWWRLRAQRAGPPGLGA